MSVLFSPSRPNINDDTFQAHYFQVIILRCHEFNLRNWCKKIMHYADMYKSIYIRERAGALSMLYGRMLKYAESNVSECQRQQLSEII